VPKEVVRSFQWALGGSGLEQPDREYHRRVNQLLGRLDEQPRHSYLAVESQRLGHEADRVLFEITGVSRGRATTSAWSAPVPV
jgi:hypothetical protein